MSVENGFVEVIKLIFIDYCLLDTKKEERTVFILYY